jgi:hypothetical protein
MGKIVIIAAFTSLLVACTNPNDGFNFEEFYTEFQTKKAAWESLGIDHYRYTVNHGMRYPCSVPGWGSQLTITVFPDERDPEIMEFNGLPMIYATEREIAVLDHLIECLGSMRRTPLTITQLFSGLEWRIQGNTHEMDHFKEYKVVYNKDYHFPELFFVRYKEQVGGGLGPTEITYFEDLREQQ